MATFVARCCRKTNRLKSVQGFGMQRYPRKICKPKKHKTVLPWQNLLPGVVEKLISANLCRVWKTHKNICKSKNKENSVAMATLVARCCRKAYQLQSVQGYGKQRTYKNIYKSKKQNHPPPQN